jgi:hypothetical protein
MQGAELPTGDVVLIVTRDELRMLNNGLNDTRASLDDAEFSTRVGATRSEARDLLDQLQELSSRLPAVP